VSPDNAISAVYILKMSGLEPGLVVIPAQAGIQIAARLTDTYSQLLTKFMENMGLVRLNDWMQGNHPSKMSNLRRRRVLAGIGLASIPGRIPKPFHIDGNLKAALWTC